MSNRDDSHDRDALHAALRGAEVSIRCMTIVGPNGTTVRFWNGDVPVQIVGLPACTVHPEVENDGVVLHVKQVEPSESTALRTSLAAVIGVLERCGGWLPHEDQEVLRQARAVMGGGA